MIVKFHPSGAKHLHVATSMKESSNKLREKFALVFGIETYAPEGRRKFHYLFETALQGLCR